MDLSVVIPVRNEAENIAPLVAEIRAALDGLCRYEIVYVDDGSTDATAAEIGRLAPDTPGLRLLRHRYSCGQSAAIRSGVRSAQAPWIATLDGDGQNDPADIARLWGLVRAASPNVPLLIAGWRRQRQDSWSKRWASRAANRIRARILGDDTPDTGCGLKLFPRALFLDLPAFDHMHRFLPALVLRAGGTVRSVPVNHRPRRRGISKYGVFDRLGVGIVDLLGVLWLQRRAAAAQPIVEAAAFEARAAPSGRSPAVRGGAAMTVKDRAAARFALPSAGVGRGLRILVVALLIAATIAAWRWRAAFDPATIVAAIDGYRAAPLVFLAVHIAASLLFVPRTLLAIAAGVLFGIGGGIFWAAIGSVAGAVAGFLAARCLSADWVDFDRGRRLRPALEKAERGGWRSVAVLRLIPVMPHSLANYGFGLTRIPLAPYAFGSLVGQLPMTIAYVDFGAAGERLMLGRAGWLMPTLIGAAALALSLLIPVIARRRLR